MSALIEMIEYRGNRNITLTFFLRQTRHAVLVIRPFRETRGDGLREHRSIDMTDVQSICGCS